MEITTQMAKSYVDAKARYCPYCSSSIHTHYGDDRYLCEGCGREYYILRYPTSEVIEDGKID